MGPALKSAVKEFPVVVLTGPRQVGKTSLLERLFPDFAYVTLDSSQEAESAETRPEEFLSRNPPPVIIDEIQYAPSLFRHIKVWVDRHRDRRGVFILTGSQNFKLMASLSESLAGRAAILPLYSLSFGEWAAAPIPAQTLSPTDFLWKGGYPGLWADMENPPRRDRWYQGYLATYLERDVRNLLNVGRLRDFERFLRAAAMRVGNVLNMSETGRDAGISPTTAREWFSVLQASNIIHLLEPYHRSLGKRITKSPKLYFTDSGLAAFLAGFSSPEALLTSPMAGAFWENHVIGQWIRKKERDMPAAALWYWQDRTKNEVDLVIELDARLYPIECKRKEKPDKTDARGIAKFREFYGPDITGRGFIACLCRVPFEAAIGVTAVRGWDTWEL